MPEFMINDFGKNILDEVDEYAEKDKPEGLYWTKVSATLLLEMLDLIYCEFGEDHICQMLQKKRSKTGND